MAIERHISSVPTDYTSLLETPGIKSVSDENERRALERLRAFQNQIRSTALNLRSISLRGIDVKGLTEEDMILFERFKKGQLTLQDIAQQEGLLAKFKKDTKASMQLLSYFKAEIRKR